MSGDDIVNSFFNEILEMTEEASVDDEKLLQIVNSVPSNHINIVDQEFGSSMLHYAIEYGLIEVIKKLLSFETIDVNISNYESLCPIHYGALSNNEEILNLLLQHPDINPNITTEEKKTALMISISENKIISAKNLLKNNNVDITLKDEASNSALYYCDYIEDEDEKNIIVQMINSKK
eukprot:TRINITY_DN1755_c0_g1_i1.p1 TRINITY_DN1755_c0_g1~~TRINITY_DN1755_c0_g1_i1.p1  ORF type:complete len:178 (+),score=42.18 TRINITY_DN1755_c0_g1_i1:102-635(+)